MRPNILFVVTGYYFNGGTTFLIRLLNELKRTNVTAGVLFLKDEGDEKLLEEVVALADVRFLLKSKFSKLSFPLSILTSSYSSIKKWSSNFQHVHVMGFFPYLTVINLINTQSVSLGVYQQDEYISEKFNKSYIQKLIHQFIKLKKPIFVFFNEENKKRYSEKFSLSDDLCVITPIGVEDTDVIVTKKDNKIVSVGNLMVFKTYFENTIRVLAMLKAKNTPYLYDIYGDGPNKKFLQNLTKEFGVADLVTFKGELPYTELYESLSSYKVLIGSGTVVIEACMVGTPSIIGVENEKELQTYGLLSDFEGLSYNEKNLDLPLFSLQDCIEKVMDLRLKGKEYGVLQKLAINRSKDFSIERTAKDFEMLLHVDSSTIPYEFRVTKKIKAIFSLLKLCIDVVLRKEDFSNRKQQS